MPVVAPETRICPIDGTIIQRGKRGPLGTYCSNACRQAAYRHRHPLGERFLRDLGLPTDLAHISLMEMLTREDRG